MFKYLLFDLDGTLTDSQEGLFKSFQHALLHFGIDEQNPENLKRFIGPPAHYAFCEFYGFSESDAIKAIEVFRERFSVKGIYENKLYPGIFDMLKSLKESGKVIALATAKPEKFAKTVIEYFDIAQFFDCVVGTSMDNTDHSKTSILNKVLKEINADKASSVMIGDRKFDIEAAKECGILSIGADYGYAPEGELKACGADFVVDSVDELHKLLNGLPF